MSSGDCFEEGGRAARTSREPAFGRPSGDAVWSDCCSRLCGPCTQSRAQAPSREEAGRKFKARVVEDQEASGRRSPSRRGRASAYSRSSLTGFAPLVRKECTRACIGKDAEKVQSTAREKGESGLTRSRRESAPAPPDALRAVRARRQRRSSWAASEHASEGESDDARGSHSTSTHAGVAHRTSRSSPRAAMA